MLAERVPTMARGKGCKPLALKQTPRRMLQLKHATMTRIGPTTRVNMFQPHGLNKTQPTICLKDVSHPHETHKTDAWFLDNTASSAPPAERARWMPPSQSEE